MNARVVAILRASAGRETVDFSLGDEGCVRSDPRLVDVEEFQRVLFFVLPFHMFLFVPDGVPPYVQQAIRPGAPFYEEGAEVEAGAILWDDKVDGIGFAVAGWAAGFVVEVR